MVSRKDPSIQIDLEQFKLHINIPGRVLSLQFDTPSRRFYLSVIALVVHQMKKADSISFVPLDPLSDVLALLNETIGGSAGSSEKKNMLPRIYRKWKNALPDLETAPLFKIAGRKKRYEDAAEKTYRFDEVTKDAWANLFEYRGSGKNISLQFSVDRMGISLDDVALIYGTEEDGKTPWDRFIKSLKRRVQVEPEEISFNSSESETPAAENEKTDIEEKSRKGRWKDGSVLVFLILMALFSLFFGLKSVLEGPGNPSAKTAQILSHQMVEKPSIAVLPFVNLNGDPAQDYLSDGITEQIITALAKIPKMSVIARNSSYSYKGKPVKVQEVGRDLGVRYVLEGSVQKSGNRIRITAQLIDAVTGHHLWAESYERDLKDLFSLQDDITKNVITALQVKLTEGESARVYGRGTRNLEAYLKVVKGLHHVYHWNKNDNKIARQLYNEAIALDPEYAVAYTLLGWTYRHEAFFWGWSKTPSESYKKAMELGQKALSLNEADSGPHMLLAVIHAETGQPKKALEAAKKGLSLDPNLSQVHWLYAMALLSMERYKDAIPWIEKAIRLDPTPPFWYAGRVAWCYFWLGYTKKSITMLSQIVDRCPTRFYTYWSWVLSMALLQDGRPEEGLRQLEKTLKFNPEPPIFFMGTYSVALHVTGQPEKAIAVMQDLMRHHPDNPEVLRHFSRILGMNGRYEEAVSMGKRAVKLRPKPFTPLYLGREYVISGQYDAAVIELEKAVEFKPASMVGRIWLAAACSLGGRMERASAEVAEIHRLNPGFLLEDCERNSFFDYQPEDKKRFIDSLKKAGLN